MAAGLKMSNAGFRDLIHPLSRAKVILLQVRARHLTGQVVAAANILLTYVVSLLDDDNMFALNELLGSLRSSMKDRSDQVLYDTRGLARIHNVLALTLRASVRLPARDALRTEYRDAVARREGIAAADDATALL